MKKHWDGLLKYSVTLAALFAFTISALVVLIVVGIAVVIAKIVVFIK
jgi:hypothetical protein